MRAYFVLTGVLGMLVLLLMVPSVLLILTYVTLGLGFAAAQILVNLFALLIILMPAVFLAQHTVIGGIILGAILVPLAVFGPAHMRDKARENLVILAPPLAPVTGELPSSVDLQVKYLRRDRYRPCSDYCLQILQNDTLDWVRLRAANGKTAMYVRGEMGVMLPHRDNGQPADMMITDYDAGSVYSKPTMFATWAISGNPKGYVIADRRLGRAVARNIEATMKGVSDMAALSFDLNVNSGATSLSFQRTKTAKVSADPGQNLKDDLKKLGIIRDEDATVSTVNSFPELELAVQQIVANNEPLDEKSQHFQDFKNIIDEFLVQIKEGIGVEGREKLLVKLAFDFRFNTSKRIRELQQTYPTLHAQLIKTIARKVEKGKTLSSMLYFVATPKVTALEEIGRYQTEISNGFKNSSAVRKEIVSYLPFLKMRNPELILDQIIEPFPSLAELDKHLSVQTRLAWQKNVPSLQVIRDDFWGYYTNDNTPDFVLFADETLWVLGRVEGLPEDYIRDWVLRWSLGRPRPYMHPWEPVEDALAVLKKLDNPDGFNRLQHYFDKNW